ncbi:TetR/AcrR family transcriptional regulator [Sphingomonas sp.]|uniref:TetR/AcrR family transcriptional regulator n=1 Tax=Sphingomonas sp. TaxID=28214 RepID=UPI0031DD1050
MSSSAEAGDKRVRMARGDRLTQLLDLAWKIVREEGTDALTLGHLAARAGVTKPVVYSHFGTREGLLATLFRRFDARQTELMDAALERSEPTLADRAHAIASSYVDCVFTQGRELPGVVAALEGSPEMERIKREFHAEFMEKCRVLLAPFAPSGDVSAAGLWSMLGAAQSLSQAAASGAVTRDEAIAELDRSIRAMVEMR